MLLIVIEPTCSGHESNDTELLNDNPSTASCSVLLAAGQAIFQASLTSNLLRFVSQQETHVLIAAGAADVHAVIRAEDPYNSALTNVFFIPAVGAAVTFLLVCGIKWKNIKTKAKQPNEEGEKNVSSEKALVTDVEASKPQDP